MDAWRKGTAGGRRWWVKAVVGVLAALWVERRFRPNTDRAIYHLPTKKTDPRHSLARYIAKIVKCRPQLLSPNYQPTFWAFNSWLNMALFLVKQKWSTYMDQRLLRREFVPADDNASLSIDWLCDDTSNQLPPDAPLLLILPTLCGSGPNHTYVMKMAAQRGWRACCFNRRGLASPLETPRWNLMGDQDDTKLQVAYARRTYSQARFVGMVGLSAGSGLLVTYLGTSSSECGIDAACCLCPAYDVSFAFKALNELYPRVNDLLLADVQKNLVLANEKLLRQHSNEAVDACLQVKSLDAILRAHVPFTGSACEKDYFKRSNPMSHISGIRCPLLIVNSEDDMVCLPENIREDLANELGGVLLLRTAEGSHIAYNEGWNGRGNYLIRTSLEFLEGAMEVGATAEAF